ncbi:mechanosensitive ion channel [Saccharibacter sp. 17.LH.SD]|uniref:mechanosensitive ion channel family protein n=1 Tax=Saccharibacter sp. 17.LH.SD TaxID=2689393 RepID=UPI0013708EC1|nr:mechanosensitive ion channel family protein [Saccharibacter sp. 17.LH.SD]MXV45071.1 mechanosensitive ion channel [Saccharibacter sp. 17.LH.SD]
MTQNYATDQVSKLTGHLAWLPAPVSSTIIMVLAAWIAQLFSKFIINTLPKLPVLNRLRWINAIVKRLRFNIRSFLMIIAALAVLPGTSFSYDTKQFLFHLFICLFIINTGFSIILIFQVVTDKYLSRIDSKENVDDITARSHKTQIRILRRLLEISFGVLTVASALMTFDAVQKFGVSLFASAGAASLIVGLSARPALTNLISGIQIAITQPIRMEDMIILYGDWAYVEEINATYVVLRTWDRRRYIVPISYFLETPFQNWTHSSPSLLGTVFLKLDYRAPVKKIRAMFMEEIAKCPDWDQQKSSLSFQVTDSGADGIAVRIVAGAANSDRMWDMCCDVRERMLGRIQEEIPEALPRGRTALVEDAPSKGILPKDLFGPQGKSPDGV